MNEVGRLLALIGLAGLTLTLLSGVCVWWLDDVRRTERTLRKVLRVDPQPALIVRGRGAGIGFDLNGAAVAVAWDAGGWGLKYKLDELTGAELIVDDRIAARVYRGEPRRALDDLGGAEACVRLRFVFDDLAYPDFELDLWLAEDEGRRGRMTASEALHEANRWLTRLEALLRRGAARRPAAVARGERGPPAPFDDDDEDDADAA